MKSKKKWLPYEEAKQIVWQANLKSMAEWYQYSKTDRPSNIPSYPPNIYPEFESWKSWLNAPYKNRNIGSDFYRYDKAREIVRGLGIKTRQEYINYIASDTRDMKLPSSPESKYKKQGWAGWVDFLGKQKYFTYSEARAWFKKHKVINRFVWQQMAQSGKVDPRIPTNPRSVYKSKFKGFCHYLGFNEKTLAYEDFIAILKEKKITEINDYVQWAKSDKKPCNVPSRPDITYKKKWKEILKESRQ